MKRLFDWIARQSQCTFLATAATVVGIAGGVKGLLSDGGSQQAQQAGQAVGTSQKYYDQLADMGKDQYDIWKAEGLPKLRELAANSKTPDRTEQLVSQAADTTKDQYAIARKSQQRALEMTRSPADPGYAALLAPSYMDEAASTSKAITDARLAESRRVDETNWSRGLQVVGAYQGLPGGATQSLSSAAGGTAGNARALTSLSGLNDSRAAQSAYGGFALASNANRWFGKPAAAATPGGSSFTPDGGYGSQNDAPIYQNDGTMYETAADGGAVTRRGVRRTAYEDGGHIQGPGTGTSDSIDAQVDGGPAIKVSNGEYVIPADVVRIKGHEFFDKLLQKYHRPVATHDGAMANGGAIRKRGLPSDVEDAIFMSMPNRAVSRRRA